MISAGLALAGLLAAVARADASIGAEQTFGSDGYRATSLRASAGVGESLYLAPRARFYRSDSSGGTYVLIGLRLGYEKGPWSLGTEGFVQPEVAGYEKSAFGADATYTVPWSSLLESAEADVGAGVMAIRHKDELAAAAPSAVSGSGSGARRPGVARSSALVVLQTDVSAFAALRWPLLAELSAEATQSLYDRDLGIEGAREAQFLELGGLDSVVQGFPDTSGGVRFVWLGFGEVTPYGSYTRTTFKLGAAPSNAYEAGARAKAGRVTLKAAYQRYEQNGFSGRNYFTAGARLAF